MKSQIQLISPDGSFAAYVARPRVTPAPVIVVVHEVFGVNADMRQSCDELAALGYLAISPDLFWRTDPGLNLTDRTEAELAKAFALYNAFDLDAGVSDIVTAVEAARTMQDSTGRVGIVGYCLGGLLTFLAAAHMRPDAAVAYYPGNADKHLAQAKHIASPLLIHLGQEDEYLTKPAQGQIVAALEDRPLAQVYSYPGCHHAFARHRGTAYDAAAAGMANGRTHAFLASHLKLPSAAPSSQGAVP